MADSDSTDAPAASWLQLERCVERLHASARSATGVREFYRVALAEAAAALGAVGGAAWRDARGARLELVCQSIDADADIELPPPEERREALRHAQANGNAEIHPSWAAAPLDGPAATYDGLFIPAPMPGRAEPRRSAAAVIELWIPAGASSLVKQGWLDFAATIGEIASDFHALDELRRLSEDESLHRQAVDLLRRVQGPRDLTGAAFELANEGRRVLGCDRLSVLMRRGGRWRLLCTSGVARVERRNEFTRLTEGLAEAAARWGEAIEHPAGEADGAAWPPPLADALAQHVDHSQSRELACAPITFSPPPEHAEQSPHRRRRQQPELLLFAESFDAVGSNASARRLVELGELCGPALARAAALDRFPVRTVLRWSDRLAALRRPARLARTLLFIGAAAGAAAALVYVPADLNVEAPATLHAAVERDVFATATGSVAEVRVAHGQHVEKDAVLIVLSDPQLALELQRVRGEMAAGRKRLDALAVTRTDRTLAEDARGDRLPLSAEQRQLEERIVDLAAQLTLLESRKDALTIRSPLAGQVLTPDVSTLLDARPVERGQVLLTIADAKSGWELRAETPQRQLGHVLAAQQAQPEGVAASVRLAGDVQHTYQGRVVEIAAAAPLEAEGLAGEASPVEIRIALESEPPAAARPGMTGSVRIHCGRRSLGYVWLHDVGATVYRLLTF